MGAPERVLILGGTADARELASFLVAEGYDVTSSLAGRTRDPALPAGRIRIGPFGGVNGLVDYVRSERIHVIVDATHPFAEQISRHAATAANECGIACMRLERPGWLPGPDDRWLVARTPEEAARRLPDGASVLLTIGKKELGTFLARSDLHGIVRTIEAPDHPLPERWRLIRARPPFDVADEMRLMRDGGIGWLVTKNAGGRGTESKLEAARHCGIGVVMIERPAKPPLPAADTPTGILHLIRMA